MALLLSKSHSKERLIVFFIERGGYSVHLRNSQVDNYNDLDLVQLVQPTKAYKSPILGSYCYHQSETFLDHS